MALFEDSLSEERSFEDMNLLGSDLTDHIFLSCTFSGCDFSNAKLRKAKFQDCAFAGCNLSNAQLMGTQFTETLFTDCKMAGLDFSTCNPFLFSIDLVRCSAPYCTFADQDLSGRRLAGSDLTDCFFDGTHLPRTDFSESRLSGARFERVNLEQADFRGATGYELDPAQCRLKKARFSYPEVLGLLKGYQIIVEH